HRTVRVENARKRVHGPSLQDRARSRFQKAALIGSHVAGPCEELSLAVILHHEESIALNGSVEFARRRLNRALSELPDRQRRARPETVGYLAHAGAQRLRYQIAENHRAFLEARCVQVRQIVADHLNRGRSRIQRRERRRKRIKHWKSLQWKFGI